MTPSTHEGGAVRECADMFPVPDRLTWYHVPWMQQAEAGLLRHRKDLYPIHGVPNNAITCLWHGLLADGPDGMVLTDDGRRLLGEWYASDAGQRHLRRNRECERCNDWADRCSCGTPAIPAAPAYAQPVQLDLFQKLVTS